MERQQVNSAEAGLLHSSFEEKGFSQVSITLKKGKLDIDKKLRICDLTPTVTHQFQQRKEPIGARHVARASNRSQDLLSIRKSIP